MKNSLVRSRFRGVYCGIATLWVAACLALQLGVDTWVGPALTLSRVRSVESLVRSHTQDLLFNNHRALRDELLREKVLTDDRNFDELHPGTPAGDKRIHELLATCNGVTPSSCVGSNSALIFGGMGADSVKLASFAIVLKTDYFENLRVLLLLEILGALGFGLLLGVVAWGIRAQEKFLLGKISLLTGSLSQVDALFMAEGIKPAPTQPALDEFVLASESLKTASHLLEDKTRQIETYKRAFEKKTKLDQLAQTMSFTSHQLKAPIEEAAKFMADLPGFMETMPKEKLLRSIQSLETSLCEAAESFEMALGATRDTSLPPERVTLRSMLDKFHQRIEHAPQMRNASFEVRLGESLAEAAIQCRLFEIESAIWNLVSNSLDAKRDTQIEMTAERREQELVVHYRDTGPGIPELLLDRVFDEYFTTKTNGSGVGLAVVRKVVERSGGSIQAVASKRGAHFELSFPELAARHSEGGHLHA